MTHHTAQWSGLSRSAWYGKKIKPWDVAPSAHLIWDLQYQGHGIAKQLHMQAAANYSLVLQPILVANVLQVSMREGSKGVMTQDAKK
eukprot:1158085-Pelagomonas_calceolata.AAC.3